LRYIPPGYVVSSLFEASGRAVAPVLGGERMNMQRLRAFQAIMRTGSVTSAAKDLTLTQPAVSKLLKALELEVGFPLFLHLTSPDLLRSQVDADLIKSNAHPVVKAEVSTPMTACALAAQGVGLAEVDAYSLVVAKTDGFQIVLWKSSGGLTYGFNPKGTANPFVPASKKILRRLAVADQPRFTGLQMEADALELQE
jgi:hypothetical protein